jgi:UDP-N-acetylmuramoyl-tripeptide--D-alanyl-D-alanine ligase
MFAVGELSSGAAREFGSGARHFDDIEALCSALDQELDEQTVVLVKGSRFMKMERVVSHCVGARKGEGRRGKGGVATEVSSSQKKGAELAGSHPSPFPLDSSQTTSSRTKEAH